MRVAAVVFARRGDRVSAPALRKVTNALVFGLLPVAMLAYALRVTVGTPTFLYDFHGDLYNAGVAILHGQDPYNRGFLAALASVARAGGDPRTTFATPVYPAPDLLAAVPFALLPYTAAALAFTALGGAALVLGLRLLGVRDPRCFGAAALSWPVFHSLILGQLNEILVLGLAICWRYRDRLVAPALALAVTLPAKLFLWPVALFLLGRRRYRAAALAAVAGTVSILGAWALLGFRGLTAYPGMLRDLSTVEARNGVSFVSLVTSLGGSYALGVCAGLGVAALLIVLAWRVSRRPGGDARALALLVSAALAASPLVWPHYLTLLFVSIALISPGFGPLWLVPLVAWVTPVELTRGHPGEIAVYLMIETIVIVAASMPLIKASISDRTRHLLNWWVGAKATVRLRRGLESTSSRSYIAAQRPNKGPEGPYYTQVEDLTPRTLNRPT